MEKTIHLCDAPTRNGQDTCGKQIPDGTSTTLTVDNKKYPLDLCDTHRAAFDKALQPWLDVARRVTRTGTGAATVRRTRTARKVSGPPAAEVRAWAKEKGRDVPKSGKLPAALIAEYKNDKGL